MDYSNPGVFQRGGRLEQDIEGHTNTERSWSFAASGKAELRVPRIRTCIVHRQVTRSDELRLDMGGPLLSRQWYYLFGKSLQQYKVCFSIAGQMGNSLKGKDTYVSHSGQLSAFRTLCHEVAGAGGAGGGRNDARCLLLLVQRQHKLPTSEGLRASWNSTRLLGTWWPVCFVIISIQIFILYTENVPRLMTEAVN